MSRLYWNARGEVLCARHAPAGDTWRFERWQRVPTLPETRELRCEACRAHWSQTGTLGAPLTDEDVAIFQGLRQQYAASITLADDRHDARAMVAREVFAEREWRINGTRLTPRAISLIDGHRGLLRPLVESTNGEPLL